MRLGWLPWVGLAVGAATVLAAQPDGESCLGKYATSVAGRTRNQRHNALLAARSLDNAKIEPGGSFSFNERVGTWSRDVGYRKAPVSFNGQLVASWGGGVCQVSSTLYNAGLLAGLEPVERHRHHHAPTYCPPGRDAAVAFSGIDLKLRNPHPFPVRIRAEIVGTSLEVSVWGRGELAERPRIVTELLDVARPGRLELSAEALHGKLRNGGKAGFDVATYLVVGNRKRLLSTDSYPPMNRIVEYR